MVNQLPIIPSPQHVVFHGETRLEVHSPVRICVVSHEARAHEISSYLCGQLREYTDLEVIETWAQQAPPPSPSKQSPGDHREQQQPNGEARAASTIVLQVLDVPTQGALPFPPPHPAEHVAQEAYSLSIGPEEQQGGVAQEQEPDQQGSQQVQLPPARCCVTASSPHGLFNGCQSLLQVWMPFLCATLLLELREAGRVHTYTDTEGIHHEVHALDRTSRLVCALPMGIACCWQELA